MATKPDFAHKREARLLLFSRSAEPAKVAKALAETKAFNAVTGSLGLNDKHDAVKSVTIIEFKDGKQAYRTTVKP